MNYSNKMEHKLCEDAVVSLVEIEADDTMMDIGEFLGDCVKGCFMDYDGFGYFVIYVNKKPYAITNVSFSIDEDAVYYNEEYICGIFHFCNSFNIKKVVWFNK